MAAPRVVLKPRRAQPFFGRHPWVYAGAIAEVVGNPEDGDEVELVSSAGNFIARGLFNSRSKIRVRLYSWDVDRPLDEAFFRERFAAAIRLRRDVLGLDVPGGACRLVFSEGDRLSGLTVDRYDRWLAVQFTSLGLALRREMLATLLAELTGVNGIYLRTERGVGKLEGVELHDGPLWGTPPDEPITVEDAGLRFRVNLAEGQKTGFYLDQRGNRLAVARYARGRSVLDAFCYTGGFGLHAANAGAASVLGVDSSGPAIALAQENAELNRLAGMEFTRADVFDQLSEMTAAGRKFDLVVLDPPKFARDRHAVPEALRGYRRLQSLALRLLSPDGVLVVCCCSGLITMEMLDDLLAQVAVEERRDLQILERRGQAEDHPVAVTCPESSYLKCLIGRVL
ncbi:MAG TPA: class I SAM-dependent rRNA methyltransferase [Gemmataceae bacterium]|nr:class I SAM-dependent rRNA methyltransferase [Gemmataceae bacterium]